MKRFFFDTPHQPFFFTGLITLCVAIFFFGVHPDSFFDVSLYERQFIVPTSRVWFLFTLFLFLLSLFYYVISRSRLKVRRPLVIMHYIFIVLFLVFFAIFSSFSNREVQRLIAGIPSIAIISFYGIIFLIDAFFFLMGLVMLFANVFSLRKKRTRKV